MSWPTFVYAYAGVMALVCLAARRFFQDQPRRLLRTLILGALLLLIGDSLAEQRGLWLIPRPSGVYILAAPVENVLLVLAALLNSLVPYLLLKRHTRS